MSEVLNAALYYASKGWRVIPIPVGRKYPDIEAWPILATTDLETINQWWGLEKRTHGIGIVTGEASGLLVVDIDVSNGKTGDESLADLEASYGELPWTIEAITGTGGRHIYFRYPAGRKIGNNAARLGPGIDIRAEGGQVLAPPTLHPNGRRYEWEASSPPESAPLADAPDWLIELLDSPTETPVRRQTPPRRTDHELPGDEFNRVTDWPDLLVPDGWTFVGSRKSHMTGREYSMWVRPGKSPSDGASATTGYNDSNSMKIFSTSVEYVDSNSHKWRLEEGSLLTKFGYFATRHHGGNYAAARVALHQMGFGSPQGYDEDIANYLDSIATKSVESTEIKVLEPTVRKGIGALSVRFVGDLETEMPPKPKEYVQGFLEQGELTVLAAPRALGKSMAIMQLACQLDRGEGMFLGSLPVLAPAKVLYCQGEINPYNSAQRWKRFVGVGQPLPNVAETFERFQFRVVRKKRQTVDNNSVSTEDVIEGVIDPRLEETIDELGIDVVVLDPYAVYLGANESSNDEVEAALASLRGISLRRGTSFIIVHHVRKSNGLEVEPEDMWRGASRLADWASTRVTMLPHYTIKEARAAGMTRTESRKFADVYFLRRGAPIDDFSVRRADDGWWHAWTPDDDGPEISASEIVNKIALNNGNAMTAVQLMDAVGAGAGRITRAIKNAVDQQLIHEHNRGSRKEYGLAPPRRF